MGIISGFTVYVVLWWGVLYMVLPWYSRPPAQPVTGHATSAPEKPAFRTKFIVTSAISAVLWLLLNYTVRHNLLDAWFGPF